MSLSVLAWRLSIARQKASERRNPVGCPCQKSHEVTVLTATLGSKRIRLSQHGALHGVWHHQGCPHSTLASTTKPGVFFRKQRKFTRDLSPMAQRRRLASLPDIPVIVLA